jgi:protein SCO1/2
MPIHLCRRLAGCLMACVLAGSAVFTLADDDHDEHAHHRRAVAAPGYTRSVQHYTIPELTLRDAGGRAVAVPALFDVDRPVLVNFVFTSCTTICPAMTAVFAQARERLGAQHGRVRMISVSIDPEYDTPARLRAYAQQFGAGSDWHFLTGERAEIVRLQQAFDAWRGSKANHKPLTLLRAAPGAPWVRLDGVASAEQLAREVAQSPVP